MSSPEYALFKQVAHIFSTRQSNNEVLEIEILQPALALSCGPLVQDGRSIGITKKALVQAFTVARRIFFDKLVLMSDGDIVSEYFLETQKDTISLDDEHGEVDFPISVVSEIILFFDCEHLTACNWRKRRLASLIRSIDSASVDNTERDRVARLLRTELTLLTTFLCSPLQRHTKSPTLWYHRLWVFTQFIRIRKWASIHSVVSGNALSSEDMQELLKPELTVVLRAGELHPKNYYAFSYMRRLHGILSGAVEEPGDIAAQLARSVLNLMLDWCLAHPRDISGWMFALWLLEAIPDQGVRTDSINSVVRFALDVGWQDESLWTFVDLGARSFGLVKTIEDTLLNKGSGSVGLSTQDRSINSVCLSEEPWKAWLARAKAFWAAGDRVATGAVK